MFLTVNDFCRLYEGVRGRTWCYDMYRLIKTVYKLDRPGQLVSVRQYCEYMNVDITDVHSHLGWSVTTTGSKKVAAL